MTLQVNGAEGRQPSTELMMVTLEPCMAHVSEAIQYRSLDRTAA
jgi:hypothetical protein